MLHVSKTFGRVIFDCYVRLVKDTLPNITDWDDLRPTEDFGTFLRGAGQVGWASARPCSMRRGSPPAPPPGTRWQAWNLTDDGYHFYGVHRNKCCTMDTAGFG